MNSTHSDYDANLVAWQRARDVIAGEDAVKMAGIKYLSRLDSQTDDEYVAYKMRAAFFNATARIADGYVGRIFRRDPTFKLPDTSAGIGRALDAFVADADLLGTPMSAYAKHVTHEVIAVGRAGTLVDWEDEAEQRAFAVLFEAEQIINWHSQRVNGRNVLTLVVLKEHGKNLQQTTPNGEQPADAFQPESVEQLRVLKLVPGASRTGDQSTPAADGSTPWSYQVELWQQQPGKSKRSKTEWAVVDTRTPLRLGKPLPLIPFVFHGPKHSLPKVDKLPLADIIALNLDHYRLNADYRHGLHFTALPTAWVSGFDKTSNLRIGSSTAWVSETPGATAGYLEFHGQGLTTFERAMTQDEQLMAVLGSRMMEAQKRVGETAASIELRQSGENAVLSAISLSISESLSQVLGWVYWWNSTETTPGDIGDKTVLVSLNADFSLTGMASTEIAAVVAAWKAGAISQDTMFDLFRMGDVLPVGRSNEDEAKLVGQIGREKPAGVFPKPGNPPVAGAIPGTADIQPATPNNQP
ncbi:MAG TPA: DUF4055 domain-containing protein [Candidatus Limnocylindrales bacterium]|nr:DUF4055 domain-containing protein [Candidatus Limnocylindrales bacterium]